MRNQVRWTTAIILAPSHLVQGAGSIPVRCKGAAASFCFEPELSHLLEVVDEHHVEGLTPATIEEEVEAIHLQEMAMWALIASPWNKSSVLMTFVKSKAPKILIVNHYQIKVFRHPAKQWHYKSATNSETYACIKHHLRFSYNFKGVYLRGATSWLLTSSRRNSASQNILRQQIQLLLNVSPSYGNTKLVTWNN